MASELRWILLGLGLPLLAGIWWWTARRSAQQAPGNAELRESSVPPPESRYSEPDDVVRASGGSRDWGVPPLEPLSIRTGGFEDVPVLDGPMMVHLDPVPEPSAAPIRAVPVQAAAPLSRAAPAPGAPAVSGAVPGPAVHPVSRAAPGPGMPAIRAVPVPARDAAPASTAPAVSASAAPHAPAAAAPSETAKAPAPGGRVAATPDSSEQQRIVTIRVCAPGENRWTGAQMMAAFELRSLAFGRYQVFHRKDADGRSLFCVASLIEPGTFNIAEMARQEFRGITLFAVLPGPAEPVATVDELIDTARGLAEDLSGYVQDGKGLVLSPQRAAAIREDVARFAAALPRH